MAKPNPGDPRAESWRPLMDTLKVETHLPPWQRRQRYIDEYVDGTMCGLIEAARERPPARSLAAIRPRKVTGIDIEPHGPWTADEQRKIDAYVNQLELPGIGRGPRTALDPPRFRGWYRYSCRGQAAASTGRASTTGSGSPSSATSLAAATRSPRGATEQVPRRDLRTVQRPGVFRRQPAEAPPGLHGPRRVLSPASAPALARRARQLRTALKLSQDHVPVTCFPLRLHAHHRNRARSRCIGDLAQPCLRRLLAQHGGERQSRPPHSSWEPPKPARFHFGLPSSGKCR